jgi:hypothetical protein
MVKPMEAPNLVPLPSRQPLERTPRDALARTTVRVAPDRLVVEHLTLVDPAVAAIVAERPDDERAPFVERALRIGLLALQSAGTTLNVDLVRAEFDKLVRQGEQANERAAQALDQALRANFGDGDGKLPRTLDKYLGERGQLQTLVGELFDEKKRDSAIGRISAMLERYFDGDASKLSQLLDPTRASSPLHQFRGEITERFDRLNERIVALEAAGQARGAERAKSAAKGADFEDLLETMLAEVARGAGDLLDRTGGETGDVMRSKKGDFVLSVNDALARGADLRIVVEAKDRAMSGREMREELREAKANRNACVALVVFTPRHAPAGIAPFDVRAGDVYCVIDPDAPDPATLEAAVRLARLLALATRREVEAEIDAEALAAALAEIRQQLDVVKGLKATLTSIGRNAGEVSAALDRLRDAILSRVGEAEAELRPAKAGRVH